MVPTDGYNTAANFRIEIGKCKGQKITFNIIMLNNAFKYRNSRKPLKKCSVYMINGYNIVANKYDDLANFLHRRFQ